MKQYRDPIALFIFGILLTVVSLSVGFGLNVWVPAVIALVALASYAYRRPKAWVIPGVFFLLPSLGLMMAFFRSAPAPNNVNWLYAAIKLVCGAIVGGLLGTFMQKKRAS